MLAKFTNWGTAFILKNHTMLTSDKRPASVEKLE